MSKKLTVASKGIEYSYTLDRIIPGNLNIRHCHECYEILFVVSGEGSYIVEGVSHEIRPGTLMIIRPFEFHSVKLDPTIPYERYVLKFHDTDLQEDTLVLFKSFMEEDENTSGKYYPATTVPANIYSTMERFEIATGLPEREKAAFVRMLLGELVVLLSVSDGSEMHHVEEEELAPRVMRYINDNLHRDVSLNKLARRFFVSKFYLCRAFKKFTGISVHGYINQKRVMYAKQLIDAGETASGAAYRVGFGDYSSFYRAYVKVTGKSPTAD